MLPGGYYSSTGNRRQAVRELLSGLVNGPILPLMPLRREHHEAKGAERKPSQALELLCYTTHKSGSMQGDISMYADRLTNMLIEILGIPSTSGHEEFVRDYLQQRLTRLGMPTQIDQQGNLIATLTGEGKPLMLNAHM